MLKIAPRLLALPLERQQDRMSTDAIEGLRGLSGLNDDSYIHYLVNADIQISTLPRYLNIHTSDI